MKNKIIKAEKHLRVFHDKSEYHSASGEVAIYPEGIMSNEAKKRLLAIKTAFGSGFLDNLITDLKVGSISVEESKISEACVANVERLIGLVTSEVGRALIGLTVMQLSIKAIVPEQSIRLHKASANRSSFSWTEGVSMRTLDKCFVTPSLRKHDLVRLNADGFMMTRSLAENYPYSDLYKAQIRGARGDWLSIVEELESGATDPMESLKLMISMLINSAAEFENLANELIVALSQKLFLINDRSTASTLLKKHADNSDYAARLLEISMHSLMQAAVECGVYGDHELKPLSQMRSANKKHGNIGDIELLENGSIIAAWDAKYGKSYLREEIEEVAEKIRLHDCLQRVAFVTDTQIRRTEEMSSRIAQLHDLYGIEIEIISYSTWVDQVFDFCVASGLVTEEELSGAWVTAYTLTLSQRKRAIAPVDEPCMEWVRSLKEEVDDMS